ncbi:MAG: 50S ribosomal protein L15 [Acidimicrobiia bacterium]|nr:50S ribosomal protein L15 [Acidimicrobiia bacterium]MDH5503590.1 50S ribosomal protein L15 [Acidimicrobiia bacterium]
MGQLQLHHLRPPDGSKKTKIRVGRGEGGRRGKTAGRGTKGTKARNTVRPGFEGGRVPLQRRIPTLRGFKNPNKEVFAVVNVEDLNMFAANSTVTSATLKADGLAKKKGRVKVLGDGEIDRPLKVQVHAVSGSAKAKIEAAGGSVEIID